MVIGVLLKWYSVDTMAKGRNTVVIHVRVSDSVDTRVKSLAAKEGITVNDWCKAALIRAAGLLPDGKVRSHHKKVFTP